MSFDEARSWFAALVGRKVHVIIYIAGMPVADLDGTLEEGVVQDRADLAEAGLIPRPPESGEVVAFQIGSSTFALAEELFVSGEPVGGSIAIELIGDTEVVAYPWRSD